MVMVMMMMLVMMKMMVMVMMMVIMVMVMTYTSLFVFYYVHMTSMVMENETRPLVDTGSHSTPMSSSSVLRRRICTMRPPRRFVPRFCGPALAGRGEGRAWPAASWE